MKTKVIVSIVLVCLLILVGWLIKELIESRQDYKRINSSFVSSQKSLEYYKGENGILVARLEVVELKNSEIRKLFPEILTEIKELKINPRQVNHYSETVIRQEKEVIKELRDSIIHDTIRVKVFDYQDEFYDVHGNILDDLIRMNISSTDSLIQIIYRGKRQKPWLWIFSPRELEQVIQSKNPSSIIVYSKSIQITK